MRGMFLDYWSSASHFALSTIRFLQNMVRQTLLSYSRSGRRSYAPNLSTSISSRPLFKASPFMFIQVLIWILLLFWGVEQSKAQESNLETRVCTQDADASTPLEGTVVVAQLDNRQPIAGTTNAQGCVDLVFVISQPTDIDDPTPLPGAFEVAAPYPNPVKDQVFLPVTLNQSQRIELALFDITGRNVLPAYGTQLAAGTHRIGLNVAGLHPGLYVYRINGERGVATGKLIKVSNGSGTAPTVQVEAGAVSTLMAPVAQSSANVASAAAIRFEAVRQGYASSTIERDVTDGEEVVLMLQKLAPGVPSAPFPMTPANGEVGTATVAVQLSWTGDALTSGYTIQVAKVDDFSSVDYQQEGLATTSYTVTGLEGATTYYWRVSATGTEGSSEWSLVYRFTTTDTSVPQPAIPVLETPVHEATDIATVGTIFEWADAENASQYHIQIATAANFSSLVADVGGLAQSSYASIDLAAGTTYYWRVQSTGDGGTSDWAEAYSFVTASDVVDPPSLPTLQSPANGANNLPTASVSLAWSAAAAATSYNVQVATTADFSVILIDQAGFTETISTLSNLEEFTTYYWRVQAAGPGGESAWTDAYRFTTVASSTVPPAPALTAPENGATGLSPASVSLFWGNAEGASSYEVELALADDFSNVVFSKTGLNEPGSVAENLDASTTYFWRVRGENTAGAGAWSDVFSFSTAATSIAPPALVAPLDGAMNITPGTVNLSWSEVAEADVYDVQLSTVSDFSTIDHQQAGVTDTGATIEGLVGATTYYWRARASNAEVTSEWSTPFSFSTAATSSAPPAPELSAPSNGATDITPGSVSLSWNAATGAATYDVQLSTADDFSSITGEASEVAATSVIMQNVAANTTYYWRARSTNAEGTSNWSGAYSFATGDGGGSTNQMIALDLMGPNDTYYGLKGGLVDNGIPTVTATNGKIIIIAISMSNGHQEFNRFIELYENHPDVSGEIVLINCAVGGSALERWVGAEGQELWDQCKSNVTKKHSLDQVKVVWAKNADQFTELGITLPDPQADYYNLVTNIGLLGQKVGSEFPSVQAIFNTSRIYGGYVEEKKQAARGEPISYEGGFATNTVIEKYKNGELPGAPWMGWGPYLWANGETPNGSGIFWTKNDFQGGNGENQHPSVFGATKVADALHDFFMQFDWYRN